MARANEKVSKGKEGAFGKPGDGREIDPVRACAAAAANAAAAGEGEAAA